jgi:glycosyltransferase involved in cell wall biosynthesis
LVSVILPTYNRYQIIERSIKSIFEQTYTNLEIVIVDDGSSDRTASVLENLAILDDRMKVVHNSCRLGLPASRNKGVSLSGGSLIFFSEDDLVLDDSCISTLVNSLSSLDKANRPVGAVGPRLISFPRRRPNEQRHVVSISPITRDIKCNFELNTRKSIEVELLHSCSLIRRNALLSVGGFESRLYKGSYSREETDFYFRLRRKGYSLFFEPHAIAYHYSGGLGGCILPSKLSGEYYNVRNHLMFSVRFYGISTLLVFPASIGTYLTGKWRGC